MDGTEGGSRYLSNYGVNQAYGSTRTRPEGSARNLPQLHSQLIADNYVDEDDEMNGSIQQDGDYVDSDDTDTNNVDGEDYKKSDGFDLRKHPKKRTLKSLSSSFELAPRVLPPAAAATPPAAKSGGRNALTDWSEHETFALLDAWGKRYLQRGRKGLRSEEWQEVVEKVSQESKLERTDTQCRNRLDTLKKKYKKDKALLEHNKIATSKWVYFDKMDMLMASKPPQQAGVSCGVDSDSQEGDDGLDLLPSKRSKYEGEKVNGGGSFSLLADSINKFSEIYEKIEYGKRKQMVELEKMRMEFYKDLELQKMQILDRARDEIARIRQGDYEQNHD